MENIEISSIIIFIIIFLVSAILNCLQFAFLTFGKYKTHKLLETKSQYRDKLLKYIDKFWDYFISISILATLFRIIVIYDFIIIIKIIFLKYSSGILKNYISQTAISNFFAIIISLFVFTFFIELIPSIIARKKTESVIVNFLSFIKYLDLLVSPIRNVLKQILTKLIKLTLKISLTEKDFILEDDDIKSLVRAAGKQGVLQKQELDMITSIFGLNETLVRHIMIPQPDVVAVPVNISLSELLEILKNSGYSRIPVYENNRDNIIGVIHTKELLSYLSIDIPLKNQNIDIRKFMHNIIYTPETKEINALLLEFQKEKVHLAVVVNEFGAMTGIITIEDILEEIVGDIKDEFDDEDDEIIKKQNTNEYLVYAKINIEELNAELAIDLPVSDEYESLAGFLISVIDDLPKQGQIIEYKNYKFEIISATATRVLRVRIYLMGEKNNSE
ncbi:MAG TPA: hemolysin family protein [bacterium]|nr:hemolysin family protein [bacterium]